VSDLLGARTRAATADELLGLNAVARLRGYRNVASEEDVAVLVEGSRAMGTAVFGLLGVAFVVVQLSYDDYWDALDEFFAVLDGLLVLAAAAALLVVGGLVALAGALT
jgi:hypothetical protein